MKSGPRETLRRGKKIVKMIPVTPIMGKIVAKTMQVTLVFANPPLAFNLITASI